MQRKVMIVLCSGVEEKDVLRGSSRLFILLAPNVSGVNTSGVNSHTGKVREIAMEHHTRIIIAQGGSTDIFLRTGEITNQPQHSRCPIFSSLSQFTFPLSRGIY